MRAALVLIALLFTAVGAAGVELCIEVPAAAETAVLEAQAARAGYQAELPCERERVTNELDVLVVAGPGDGGCTAARAGETVPNPQPMELVALRYLRHQLLAEARDHHVHQRVEATRATARTEADTQIPEPSTTPAPETTQPR